MLFDKKTNKLVTAPSDLNHAIKHDPQLKELAELRSKLALHETNTFKATLCDEVVALAGDLNLNFTDTDTQNLLTAFSKLIGDKNLQIETVKASAQAAIETSLAMSEILVPGAAELSDMEEEKPVDARHQALLKELAKMSGDN